VRRIAPAWALALAGLWIAGSAASFAPRGWLPDPALLVAVGAALRLPATQGLLVAFAVGSTADALSGGPLGLQALLDLLAWALTRAAARRVDLTRPVLLAPLAASLTVAHAAGLAMLGGTLEPSPETGAILAAHALANALAAPAVAALLDALVGRFELEEPPRGSLRLDPGAGAR
jgi:rod shape-determining protein MreD